MVQREWVEKDFYKVLGVSSDASEDGSSGSPASCSPRTTPTATPTTRSPTKRYKEVGEARDVLTDPAKRKNTTRPGGCSPAAVSAAASTAAAGAATTPSTTTAACGFNLNDLFGQAGQDSGANIGDLFGGLFGRRAAAPSRPAAARTSRPRPTSTSSEATKGVAMPLRLTSPAPCTTATAAGAPGTSPKVCATCNGSGVINRNQGAFGSPNRAPTVVGSGSIIEHPRDDAGERRRHHPDPHHQRADPTGRRGRSAHPAGRPGRNQVATRAPCPGDLYVTVHVRPDKVFAVTATI